MRVLRFMSADEAIRLLDGQTIHRDTDHKAHGNKTTSVGACFAIFDNNHLAAMYDTAQLLAGIAMMDACLLGTLKPDHRLKHSKGWYRDGWMQEMSATEYSLDDFTDWLLYTPELPYYGQMFKIISSANWMDPVLTRSSEV